MFNNSAVNSANETGRLVRNARTGFSNKQHTSKYAHMTLAVDYNTNKDDNNADYINVTVFGPNSYIDKITSFIKKGTLVTVHGRLHSSNYIKQIPGTNYQFRMYTLGIMADSILDLETKKSNSQKNTAKDDSKSAPKKVVKKAPKASAKKAPKASAKKSNTIAAKVPAK